MNVLLYSSGLDSFLAREWLTTIGNCQDLKLVYINYKGRYSLYEINMLMDQQRHFGIEIDVLNGLDLSQLEDDKAYIPNRNFLMIMMAHSYTGAETFWIGGTKTDNVNDNNVEAMRNIGMLLTHAHDKEISCGSPFYHLYKTQILDWWVNIKRLEGKSSLSIAHDLAEMTFSCYEPIDLSQKTVLVLEDETVIETDTHECLKCPACFRKNVELYAGAKIYRPFFDDELMNKYANRFEEGNDIRSLSTMEYINATKI